MYAPVLFFHLKIIFYGIILGIEPPGNLVANAQAFCPVKTIIGK